MMTTLKSLGAVMPRKNRFLLPLLLVPALFLPVACSTAPEAGLANCPQPRATRQAPEPLYSQRSPLSAASYDHDRARRIFETNDGGGCAACHGRKGDGRGPLAAKLTPAPRNFTCHATMDALPDGQLFWIIRNGSPDTPMLSHAELSDEETWQVVAYIRELGR